MIAIYIFGAFIAGYVFCFFVMRNNPKYFNIDKMAKKMAKEELAIMLRKIQSKV